MLISIVDHIDLNEAYSFLKSPFAGAVNIFLGTVRNNTKGKEVEKLVFEAYAPMAIKEMKKIAETAQQRWPLEKIAIQHVTGEKLPGDPVVFIGVTSPHRAAAFEACRFLIDELKKTVPIWKKEFFADQSVWVNAHP